MFLLKAKIELYPVYLFIKIFKKLKIFLPLESLSILLLDMCESGGMSPTRREWSEKIIELLLLVKKMDEYISIHLPPSHFQLSKGDKLGTLM